MRTNSTRYFKWYLFMTLSVSLHSMKIAYLFNLKIVQDNYFKGRVQRIKEMLKILKCWVTNELYLFNYTSLKDFLLFDIIFERYCNMIHVCKILGFLFSFYMHLIFFLRNLKHLEGEFQQHLRYDVSTIDFLIICYIYSQAFS